MLGSKTWCSWGCSGEGGNRSPRRLRGSQSPAFVACRAASVFLSSLKTQSVVQFYSGVFGKPSLFLQQIVARFEHQLL